jgi:type IV secretory pathway TraG/TraD family ATPase VirD4
VSLFWEVQRLGFQAASNVLRASGKAVGGAVRAGRNSADAHRLNRARLLAGRGILAPGDPPVPPGSDVLDYRGLCPTRSLKLAQQGLSLGQVLDVRHGLVGVGALPFPTILRHACIIGPSGSGKTHSVIVPWTVALLASGCSVVTIDVKGDFLQEVQSYLAELGTSSGARGFVWDYAAPNAHRWNFLSEITGDQGLDAAVVSLIGRQKEHDGQPYFYQRDYRWLKGLIRLALQLDGAQAVPARLLELLGDFDRLAALVPRTSARAELSDLVAMHPSDFSRDISGLLNALAVFQEPNVRRSTSANDFTLTEVASDPTLLVAVAKMSDGRRAEQMSSLLISQFTQSVLARFGARTQPLIFMIDEAPRLKDRIDLEQLLSVARGATAGICLAAQDVSQFGNEHQQSALLANCHTYVSMYGVSPASAEYFSKRLGTRIREELSININGQRKLFEGPSQSRQSSVGPVLGPSEIMFPPFGAYTALVHCPSAAASPFMIDLER